MEDYKKIINSLLFMYTGSQDLVDKWWKSPNKAFEGQCPKDIEDITQIYEYLVRFNK